MGIAETKTIFRTVIVGLFAIWTSNGNAAVSLSENENARNCLLGFFVRLDEARHGLPFPGDLPPEDAGLTSAWLIKHISQKMSSSAHNA